jgi:hypothetical protein
VTFPVPARQAVPAALVELLVELPDDVVERDVELGLALDVGLLELDADVDTAGAGVGGLELHAPTAATPTMAPTNVDPTPTLRSMPCPMAPP